MFKIHLTIIFRYKVTSNANISGTTSKKFLSHVRTKNELTIYLAEKAVTNFENVNGGYAVSCTTKYISNLEDFAQEMMMHDHEEADSLLLLHAADASTRNPLTELHIYSLDTDAFLLTIHKYPILWANRAFKTGSGKQARTIPVRSKIKESLIFNQECYLSLA